MIEEYQKADSGPKEIFATEEIRKDENRNRDLTGDAYANALFTQETPAAAAGYFRVLGLSSLLYAIVYTVCMYQNSSGITMPVWIAAAVWYSCAAMKRIPGGIGRLRPGSLFYIVVMLLLGVSVCMTDQPYMILFDYFGFLGMLLLFLLHNFCDDRQWDLSKRLAEMIVAVFGAVGCMLTPFTDGFACWQEKGGKKNHALWAALLGLLFAVPGVLLLGFCLMSADAVFDAMVTRLLAGVWVPVRVFRVLVMLLFGYFSSYCGLRYLACRSRVAAKVHRTAFHPAAAMAFVGLILVMYLVFSGIQVWYLFAGSGRLPQGMSYAQYAQRGFYMLLFVCVVNVVLVMLLRKYFAPHQLLNAMLLLLCVCTYVMLASSAYRMCLYIHAYQLTFLRVLVLAALAVLALLLVGVMLYIIKAQFPLFRYMTAVVSVSYLMLSFARVDGLIASYNLSHMEDAAQMDWEYLSRLSLDAAAAVADYYAQAPWQVREEMECSAQLAKQLSDGIGGGLEWEVGEESPIKRYWFVSFMQRVYDAEKNLGLRSFNFSRCQAVRLLNKIENS